MATAKRWAWTELSASDQRELQQIYGPQSKRSEGFGPWQILEVREPEESERWFFERKNFVSPKFLVQTLYKVKGKLEPVRFTQSLREFVQREEALRTNYCLVAGRVLKVIFMRRKKPPESVFQNISDQTAEEIDSSLRVSMEAGMRQAFDIVHGDLVSLEVFRTAAEECAVVVTAAQLIADGLDWDEFFLYALGDRPLAARKAPRPVPQRTRALAALNLVYWRDLLGKFPALPELPYTLETREKKTRQAYRTVLAAGIVAELERRAGASWTLCIAILQTAWGILLQNHNKSRNLCFCSLVAREDAGSSPASGSAFNMLPVRVSCEDGMPVGEIVRRQAKQLSASMSHSDFNWESLQKSLGLPERRFDHFLSFHDFHLQESRYSDVPARRDGAPVLSNSWDAGGMKLGIYFHRVGSTISMTFLYDENRFMPFAGGLISYSYSLVLQQMLLCWDDPFEGFSARVAQDMSELYQAQDKEQAEGKEQGRDIFSRMELFRSVPMDWIRRILDQSRWATCFAGDRIREETLRQNLVFVLHGSLARSLLIEDGWYCQLDTAGRGHCINMPILLASYRGRMLAEVRSEQAQVMLVPTGAVREVLRIDEEMKHRANMEALDELEHFRSIWARSEE